MYSGSASASPAYASSPVAPPAVKSSKGKDKMSPVRMPAAGSSQVQVSRGSPRVQRQIKMEFDHDGTEIIMPALPFTAQSERQVWLDEAPRGPWPGPKNGGSMPSVTGVFKAWSANKYAKVASVKSYKGGGKMLLRCSTRVKNGVVIGSDNEEGDYEVEILDDCDRCPFKAHIRTTVDGQYYYLVKSSSTLIHTCIQDPSHKSAPSASYISTLQTVTNAHAHVSGWRAWRSDGSGPPCSDAAPLRPSGLGVRCLLWIALLVRAVHRTLKLSVALSLRSWTAVPAATSFTGATLWRTSSAAAALRH